MNPYEQTLEGVKSLKRDQLQKEQERLEKISKVKNFEEFGVREDQNCNDAPRFFGSPQPRTAISSFPGSGNTWARHLLHMASGYWVFLMLVRAIFIEFYRRGIEEAQTT